MSPTFVTLNSAYHLPELTAIVLCKAAVVSTAVTPLQFPWEKTIAVPVSAWSKGLNVAKLLVHVSVAWSVAARLTSVRSVPPLASLPKLLLSSKS